MLEPINIHSGCISTDPKITWQAPTRRKKLDLVVPQELKNTANEQAEYMINQVNRFVTICLQSTANACLVQ